VKLADFAAGCDLSPAALAGLLTVGGTLFRDVRRGRWVVCRVDFVIIVHDGLASSVHEVGGPSKGLVFRILSRILPPFGDFHMAIDWDPSKPPGHWLEVCPELKVQSDVQLEADHQPPSEGPPDTLPHNASA
jgi:hypothetical protein